MYLRFDLKFELIRSQLIMINRNKKIMFDIPTKQSCWGAIKNE